MSWFKLRNIILLALNTSKMISLKTSGKDVIDDITKTRLRFNPDTGAFVTFEPGEPIPEEFNCQVVEFEKHGIDF